MMIRDATLPRRPLDPRKGDRVFLVVLGVSAMTSLRVELPLVLGIDARHR